MYCFDCGYQVFDDDDFCYRCGCALRSLQPTVDAAAAAGPLPPPWRGGQVALGIFLILASLFPVVQIAAVSAKLAGQFEDAAGTWGSSHLMGITILAVVWVLALHPHRLPISSLGLTLPAVSWRNSALLALAALGASLLTTLLYSLLVKSLGWGFIAPPEIPLDIVFPGLAGLFTYEALALWTPFTEEIFFRGFVLAGLSPRLGAGRAMVASALIFSGFHVSPGLIVPVFITGLLLAWLYRRTGSLWPGICAHAGQNAIAILLTSLEV